MAVMVDSGTPSFRAPPAWAPQTYMASSSRATVMAASTRTRMSSEPSKRTYAPRCASRPASSGLCRNIVNGPWSAPRLCTIESTVAWSFAATWFLLVIGVSLAMMSSSLVRDRPVELHLDPALGEAFFRAALAVGRQVGRLAMGVERGIVLVLLVEDEDVRILRGAVRAIDETTRLRALHLRDLLL